MNEFQCNKKGFISFDKIKGKNCLTFCIHLQLFPLKHQTKKWALWKMHYCWWNSFCFLAVTKLRLTFGHQGKKWQVIRLTNKDEKTRPTTKISYCFRRYRMPSPQSQWPKVSDHHQIPFLQLTNKLVSTSCPVSIRKSQAYWIQFRWCFCAYGTFTGLLYNKFIIQ